MNTPGEVKLSQSSLVKCISTKWMIERLWVHCLNGHMQLLCLGTVRSQERKTRCQACVTEVLDKAKQLHQTAQWAVHFIYEDSDFDDFKPNNLMSY
jgi:hypothetical protein